VAESNAWTEIARLGERDIEQIEINKLVTQVAMLYLTDSERYSDLAEAEAQVRRLLATCEVADRAAAIASAVRNRTASLLLKTSLSLAL